MTKSIPYIYLVINIYIYIYIKLDAHILQLVIRLRLFWLQTDSRNNFRKSGCLVGLKNWVKQKITSIDRKMHPLIL